MWSDALVFLSMDVWCTMITLARLWYWFNVLHCSTVNSCTRKPPAEYVDVFTLILVQYIEVPLRIFVYSTDRIPTLRRWTATSKTTTSTSPCCS
jgi:hypothetical protein